MVELDASVRLECDAIFTVHLHWQCSGPGASTVLCRYWTPACLFVHCACALLAAKRNNASLSGVTMYQSPFKSVMLCSEYFELLAYSLNVPITMYSVCAGVSRCGGRSRGAARTSPRAESVAPCADDRGRQRRLTTTASRVRASHHL